MRGVTLRTRRAALASMVAVIVLAGAGLSAWWLVLRDPNRAAPGERAQAVQRNPERISPEELRHYPPIVVLWAASDRAEHTASGDLYVVRPSRAGARRVKGWKPYYESLRDGPYGAYDARWSRDRKLIALNLSEWYGDPYGQVAVVSPDGRVLQKLGPASAFGNVSWSPDGRTLVYSSGGDVLTVSPQRETRTRIFKSAAYLSGTDWAPDGRHVVVGTANGIVKAPRDGAKAVKLTRGPDGDPAWSPDGRTIAFVRARGAYGDFHDLYVVRADGQRLRRLVANARAPIWSPNGRSILFTETEEIEAGVFGSDGRIGVIGSDGRHRRTLASGDALAWAPDGKKILFERQARRGSELWVMDANGKRQTRLQFGRPRWSVITADWGR
jgi:dipeptidyl aminopeptidase/acylaminoacyl peptidase